jgi:hypothetical protein
MPISTPCPQVFNDRDLGPKRDAIERALQAADVFFGSLLFDYDQVCRSVSLLLTSKTELKGV